MYNGLSSGVLLKMEVGIRKRGWRRAYLFMITQVSIRCQKKTRRLVYGVYPRIPPQYTTGAVEVIVE